MGKLRKIGKKIGRGIKSVGKKFKKGLGKIAKAFGKLGPLGSIALSFMLPGIGSWISSVAQGSSFLAPIAQGLVKAGNFVKNGVGKVFNKVTDAIEYSMNKVSCDASCNQVDLETRRASGSLEQNVAPKRRSNNFWSACKTNLVAW